MGSRKQPLGVLFWKADEEFGRTVVKVLTELGYPVRHATDPRNLDLPSLGLLLVYGPWGSLEPAVRLNQSIPANKRCRLVLWQSEQFPNPHVPTFMWKSIGGLRSHIESVAFVPGQGGDLVLRRGGAFVTGKLHRYRYYGDALRYFNHDRSNVLAVWSTWIAQLLKRRGLDAMFAPMGYHPDFGTDLGLKRDIPVLWLGKTGSGRRGRLLARIRSELAVRGIELMVIDGVENPYVFGAQRTRLLNRTKVVLNLLRQEWDNTSMRFFLSAGNRATVVGEPMYPHIPFQPGVHCVEAPISQLAETIHYYVQHDAERMAIADRAHDLVVNRLTMARSLQSILNVAQARKPNREN